VAAAHPDLVGLQEVSRWTVSGPSPAPSLDFLAILQAQLAARGLHYDVAAVSDNADIGPLPLVGPLCTSAVIGACTLRFQDRDVILVNHDRSDLAVGNPRTGTYAAQVVVQTPVGPLSFSRGWATVDATLGSTPVRFAVTHLETEDAAAVQEAQGREFLAAVKAPGAVVAVGDFNSAADGSQTATYGEVTADYFRDAWPAVDPGPGLTCCQSGFLASPTSLLHSRIDLVLTHAVHPVSAQVVGATPFQGAPPFWPSDHAGVVARLRLH
jgi:endonuclease/exonuclease/phosphatase family metal-dependent hydrolase